MREGGLEETNHLAASLFVNAESENDSPSRRKLSRLKQKFDSRAIIRQWSTSVQDSLLHVRNNLQSTDCTRLVIAGSSTPDVLPIILPSEGVMGPLIAGSRKNGYHI